MDVCIIPALDPANPRKAPLAAAGRGSMGTFAQLSICALSAFLTWGFSGHSAQAMPNIVRIAPGIYFGPAPRTDADYGHLQRLGIKTIVELRRFKHKAIDKERRMARAYGFCYRHVPMGFRKLRDGSPERVLRLLTDCPLHPIYVHCNLGRDRTGLVIALYRVRYQGWSRQAAKAEWKQGRFNPLLRGLDRYFKRRA